MEHDAFSRATADPLQAAIAADLAERAATFYAKGWLPGTSGSLSVCSGREPLALLVTVSGKDKGRLSAGDFLNVVDRDGIFETLGDPKRSSEAFYRGGARPSGEVLVHRAIYLNVSPDRAGCVLHTHSIFNTLCSQLVAPGEALVLPDVEMIKGLGRWEEGERVAIPVVANHRKIPELAEAVGEAVRDDVPGVLVAGHGIYAFGPDPARAARHLESFEFLFELLVRQRALGIVGAGV